MEQMKLAIELLSPVVLATSGSATSGSATILTATQDHFSGSILRGVLATRYIAQQHLAAAEDDATFLRLFFGTLRFADATIASGAKRAIALPASLQKEKTGTAVLDLLQDAPVPGYKALRGYGTVESGTIHPVHVKKSIQFHMSRSDQKTHDGRERLAGRSSDGSIYNYEALDAGQCFWGAIYGPAEDLAHLRKSIGECFDARIGRSHNTQYGACRITLQTPESLPSPGLPAGDSLCLRLETPLIPGSLTAACDARRTLARIADALNGATGSASFHLATGKTAIFAREEAVDNFISIWGMRRPRDFALAAGSVCRIQKDGTWTASDLAALTAIAYDGIGERREEGFGQLRILEPRAFSIHPSGKLEGKDASSAPHAIKNDDVRRLAKRILTARITELVRTCAAADAIAARTTFPAHAAHFFSRLDAMLAHPSLLSFRNDIASAKGNETTHFTKGLRTVKIHGRPLGEYLEEAALSAMPYQSRDIEAQLDPSFPQALRDLGLTLDDFQKDERLFYEYWHWFFRYARKAAAKTLEGAEGE